MHLTETVSPNDRERSINPYSPSLAQLIAWQGKLQGVIVTLKRGGEEVPGYLLDCKAAIARLASAYNGLEPPANIGPEMARIAEMLEHAQATVGIPLAQATLFDVLGSLELEDNEGRLFGGSLVQLFALPIEKDGASYDLCLLAGVRPRAKDPVEPAADSGGSISGAKPTDPDPSGIRAANRASIGVS